MFLSEEQESEFIKIWILDARHMLVSFWNNVKFTTISIFCREVDFLYWNNAGVNPLQKNKINNNGFNIDDR